MRTSTSNRVAPLCGLSAAFIMLILLAGCAGTSAPTNTTTQPAAASKLKSRVYVSNQGASLGSPAGQIVVIDAEKDQVFSSVTVGGVPSFILVLPDKSKTLVYSTDRNALDVINNTTEVFSGTLPLTESATSAVLMPDNNTGFAALRNLGQVALFDIGKNAVTATISVLTVRTLVLSHDGKKLLAFSDDFNTVTVIDTATQAKISVNAPQFDRPVGAVFSSDDSKAFILNCGRECGGNSANVTVLDMASATAQQSIPVSAATVGLLDGSNLYVAGTQGTAGKLDVVNTSTLAVSKSGVPISDGFHTLMALGSNGKLFIGARTCNNVSSGCLTIFNTAAQTAVVDAPKGDVTGMQPISGRNVVYVCEGGELRIYDTTKDAEQTSPTIDIAGKAIDVKSINP